LGLKDKGAAFVDIYRTHEHPEWAHDFAKRAKQKVSAVIAAGRPVILDGAVAHTGTLTELLSDLPDPVIVYIHPQNLALYERNLTSRFLTATSNNKAGLPVGFWDLVDSASFAVFCETRQLTPDLIAAIQAYARESQKSSETRLTRFQDHFNLLVVYL
jgi:hypothetical protein